MIKKEIRLTREFKIKAVKAILAVLFFVTTYLLLLILAVLLTGLCIAGGILLIAFRPSFLTVILGIGLASLGVLILIFLLKFIFKSHKMDRSHLIEIEEYQEPELYKMIDEIVQNVGTDFPKKIYLSSEVNASVFYDSNFWSMFLPVKKDLVVGLGLVNTVTKEELKAILSHEFGHFSQRTMKVGSYVYNVNQVIFNMLFDNEPYQHIVQKWVNVSGFFSIFVVLAGKINEGIQWILRKLYIVVNKNYLGLSREMEFHADAIAAGVTGYEPLTKALLRAALADASFNNVLNFYDRKIPENIKSDNLYSDQSAILNFLSEKNRLPITNDLPDISLEEQSKYNKSKLVIKDQWASHPTIEERIKRLEKTGVSSEATADYLANKIFSDIQKMQKQLTDKIFGAVSYEGETKIIGTHEFLEEYKKEVLSDSFSEIYNGYYDHKNPINFDLNGSRSLNPESAFEELYSDDKVDLVYSALALQNDIETLKNISNNTSPIKTYDYDGVRYKRKDATGLIDKLKQELEKINKEIKINDSEIYAYFKKAEDKIGNSKELERLYRAFFEFDGIFDSKYEIYTTLLKELQFVSVTTPFEEIKANFRKISSREESLKGAIHLLLSDAIIQPEITSELRVKLEQYTSVNLEYFGGSRILKTTCLSFMKRCTSMLFYYQENTS